MNRGWTNILESKKLLELGLSPETADMEWVNLQSDDGEDKYEIFVNSTVNHLGMSEDIPAWSLSTLLGLIPFSNQLSISYKHVRIDVIYKSGNDSIYTETGDDYIDAVFKIVVWLLENNYINKGE